MQDRFKEFGPNDRLLSRERMNALIASARREFNVAGGTDSPDSISVPQPIKAPLVYIGKTENIGGGYPAAGSGAACFPFRAYQRVWTPGGGNWWAPTTWTTTFDDRGMPIKSVAAWWNESTQYLPIGTVVIVVWIGERWWLLNSASIGLIGGKLEEDHPGMGVVFEIVLGEWSSADHNWVYGTEAVKAIDWRCGVPYPDAGATGLFISRPSDEYGEIWETVALDCTVCEYGSS